MDASHIFSWRISTSYDDKGNAMVYHYVAEDSQGVDLSQASELNQTDAARSTNRYLKRILYGNPVPNRDADWRPTDPLQLTGWMFEVVFDYGEGHYSEDQPDELEQVYAHAQIDPPPGAHWPVRADPFSSYRPGFEERTYRLCQRVLMFHHFAELGAPDYLVRATEFAYDQSGVFSFMTDVAQSGFTRQADGRYLKKSLPPLAFGYSQIPTPEQLSGLPIQEVDPQSLENLPSGLSGPGYQWLDLDGEGVPGILIRQAGAWFLKRNLSPLTTEDPNIPPAAQFAPINLLVEHPNPGMESTGQQFVDLTGDGLAELVKYHPPLAGYFERAAGSGWEPFTSFTAQPDIPWDDPNLRFIDLTGDGFADLLLTEEDAFTWYPSLATQGFGPAERVPRTFDEEQGPQLILADGSLSIYLADLSGDGLSDLVRVRNGEVCYWPNLGYGRFGAKVSMDGAPWFDSPDLFDQRRIRLADLDGSGTTDIIYLGRDGAWLYFNQSGNAWSQGYCLGQFPPAEDISTVNVMDLFGSGTACLVWSSPLPGVSQRQMRYMDLMDGQKPHLLVSIKNNLGAETSIRYAPSTYFAVADRNAGQPWRTRLPFPVHVVLQVDTLDRVSCNRFSARYSYHHGYFDGWEREFRGFAMVEEQDTQELAALTDSDTLPPADNTGADLYIIYPSRTHPQLVPCGVL